jgi:hypothetical protein
MLTGVVLVLDPASEGTIERVRAAEVERATQEVFAYGSEESLDFSLRRPIADGGVAKQTAEAFADLGDLLGGVDASMIDVLWPVRLCGEPQRIPPHGRVSLPKLAT